jgi:hypothetical protein
LIHSNIYYSPQLKFKLNNKLENNFETDVHKILSLFVKQKLIPLQSYTVPEGSRRFRLPDFKTIGT